MTNYERIKQMSIEEMQEFLINITLGDVDTARTYCDMCKGNMYDCDDCVMWWLNIDSKEHPQGLDYWG